MVSVGAASSSLRATQRPGKAHIMGDCWAPQADGADLDIYDDNDEEAVEEAMCAVEAMFSSAVPGDSAPLVGHAPAQQGKKPEQPAKKSKPKLLKRRVSEVRPPEVRCTSRLCVWGSKVRVPHVVHPTVRTPDMREWLVVTEHAHWLRRACAPEKGSTHWTARFQEAVTDLRKFLKNAMDRTLHPTAAAVDSIQDALGLREEDGPNPKKRRTSGQSTDILIAISFAPHCMLVRLLVPRPHNR